MARRRRKTKSEQHQEWTEAEDRVWEEFRPRLEALNSLVQAQILVQKGPPPDSPGRRYYSNLDFFLGDFTIPNGSSYAEKALNLQFIQRLDAAGALLPGAGQRVQEELRRAMEAQGNR